MANFDMNELIKVARDGYKGSVEKFSVKQSQELLREALVEANGGKTALDYKAMRRGQNQEVFAILEELIPVVIHEGLVGDEYFMNLVDYRNVAEGDQNNFLVEDNNLFVVSRAANGTQAIRRQRLGGITETPIETDLFIVAESFRRDMLNKIYALWSNATAAQMGGTTYFPAAGTYNEDALLELIAHVEAAAGDRKATIIGTKKALRNLKEGIFTDPAQAAKDEIHNLGYFGKFYGTPCVEIPQRHQVGSTNFLMNDNILTIVAGDDKPIKVVREGEGIVHLGDPFDNQDLSQEYIYGEKYGMGILLAGGNSGIGRYEMT